MGGSALIMACVSIGIVLAISAQQKNATASEPIPAS
jgi:cell division protein FtsW (lipid II flippase)